MARSRYHGLANRCRPDCRAGARRSSAAWLYEMNALYLRVVLVVINIFCPISLADRVPSMCGSFDCLLRTCHAATPTRPVVSWGDHLYAASAFLPGDFLPCGTIDRVYGSGPRWSSPCARASHVTSQFPAGPPWVPTGGRISTLEAMTRKMHPLLV